MAMPKVVINVTSDVLCPFCWIGKRSLETALKQLEGKAEFEVVWHPFFLNKDIPEGGVDKMQSYSQKFGRERAEVLLLSDEGPVKQYGKQLGLTFNYKEGCKIGNTEKAHRLLWLVNDKHGAKRQNELAETLFRQYFEENRNPGDMDTVLDAAEEVGLDRADMRAFLESNELKTEVSQYYRQAHRRGVNGVPHFDMVGPTGKEASTGGARRPGEFVSILNDLLR